MKMRPGTQTGFLLCGKEWTEGEALEVRSPWDQGLVGRVTVATRADARQAVNHAVASLRRTRALPRWKRREILEDVAAALIEQKERFAQLIVAEAGKPVRLARAEVDRAVLTFKTAAEEAARLGGESLPLDLTEGNEGRWGLVQRFPVGPVLAITPFNFPLNLVAHKLAPGHGRRLPGDSEARAADPVYRAGAGRGDSEGRMARGGAGRAAAEQCRHRLAGRKGRPHQAGQLYRLGQSGLGAEGPLRAQARAAGTGRQCRADRSRRLARPGRSGLRTARAAFGYAGQSCISVQRVFVERSDLPDFLVEGGGGAAKLAAGDPSDEATEVGPLIRLAEAERVEAWIKEAVAGGAKLVAGGERHGSVITPAILTGTKPGMKVRDEEVFGPVVAIEPYDDFEQALADVNHSKYGLQAGLLTRDAGRILTAYRELEVGALIVGDTPSWRSTPCPSAASRTPAWAAKASAPPSRR
jgi:acyl-CoA reductase-like NAD-dependent aldehyde dehydrogenase